MQLRKKLLTVSSHVFFCCFILSVYACLVDAYSALACTEQQFLLVLNLHMIELPFALLVYLTVIDYYLLCQTL